MSYNSCEWKELFKTEQNRSVLYNKKTKEWAIERHPGQFNEPTTDDCAEIVRYEGIGQERQNVYILLAYFVPCYSLWLVKERPNGMRLFTTGFTAYRLLTRDRGHMFSSDTLIENIVHYADVKIRRHLPEGSRQWQKEISKIIEAIQKTLHISSSDSTEMNEIVRDVIQSYEKEVSPALKTNPL